jgi:hypothetical protein
LALVVLELVATLQAVLTEATQYFQQLHLRAVVAVHRVVTINLFLALEVLVAVQVELARGLEQAEVAQPIKVLQVVKVWEATLIYQLQAAVQTRLLQIAHLVVNQVEQA